MPEVVAVDVRYVLPSHLRGACRQDLHRIVMAGFADGVLPPDRPRSDSGCLFRVEGSSLLVRHRVGLVHQIAGLAAVRRDVSASLVGRRYRFAVEVNAERAVSQRGSLPEEVRRLHSPRGRRVAVPNEDLAVWAQELLGRKEIGADEVTVSPRYSVRRAPGSSGGVPAVQLRAVVDGGPALDRVTVQGVGRAKSYGLGLCVISDV